MLLTQPQTRTVSFDRSSESKRIYFYEKGDYVPLLASGFWQVDKGVVQLSRTDINGDEVTLGWATPNTSFSVGLSEYTHYLCVGFLVMRFLIPLIYP
jgi:hypothetical protein